MKNITLAIEEDLLARVRVVAAQRGTTVNALVREHMEDLAKDHDRLDRARRELRELSEKTLIDLGPDYRFNREDAYAGRGVPGHERAPVRGTRKEG